MDKQALQEKKNGSSGRLDGSSPNQQSRLPDGCGHTSISRSMADVMRDVKQAEEAHGATKNGTSSMNAPEYRAYVLNCILQMPIHSSQVHSSISVHISDEGFAAMQADAEYEAWGLDTLARNLTFQDPWSEVCGGHSDIHTFWATKEEYGDQSWWPHYMNGQGTILFESKSAGATWHRDSDTSSGIGANRCSDDSTKLRPKRLLRKLILQHSKDRRALLEPAAEQGRLTE